MRNRAFSRRAVLASLGIAALDMSALARTSSRSGPDDGSTDTGQEVWRSVDLIGIDSGAFSIGQVNASVIVIHLWASWCAACLGELASLQGIARRLGPAGLTVLLVSHPKNWEADQAFLQRASVKLAAYTLAPETPWNVRAAAFAIVDGSYAVPRTLVFTGSERRCVLVRDGALDWCSPLVATHLEAWLRAAV